MGLSILFFCKPGASMSAIRDKAARYLQQVPEPPNTIGSLSQAALFTKLTGTPHERMKANWDTGGYMTACNGFTGTFAVNMGASGLFMFDLEGALKKEGKSYAWIKSAPDAMPKFGDICRYTAFHVGVSLGSDGKYWRSADAGQGGPKVGQDFLRRKYRNYMHDWTKLQGWVDLDLYFGDVPDPSLPNPEWLAGWWKMIWQGQDWYYFFDQTNTAVWTQQEPTTSQYTPFSMPLNQGQLTVTGPTSFTVVWNDTGSVETFNLMGTDKRVMGMWNDREYIMGSKL
jgi:hypothetical protein